jgi:hypothetical protein
MKIYLANPRGFCAGVKRFQLRTQNLELTTGVVLLPEVPADSIPLQKPRNHCEAIGVNHDAHDN